MYCINVFLYDHKKGILFEKRSDNGKWCVPGGGLELGENQDDGLFREVKEETNLDIYAPILYTIRANVHMIYPNIDEVYYTDIVYLVTKYSGDLKPDKESVRLEWFNINNLPDDIMDTQIDYILMFLDELKSSTIYDIINNPNVKRLSFKKN